VAERAALFRHDRPPCCSRGWFTQRRGNRLSPLTCGELKARLAREARRGLAADALDKETLLSSGSISTSQISPRLRGAARTCSGSTAGALCAGSGGGAVNKTPDFAGFCRALNLAKRFR